MLRLRRVVSFTVPANVASWRLMERLGMRKIGEFDHPNVPEGNNLRRHVLYEIAAPDQSSLPQGEGTRSEVGGGGRGARRRTSIMSGCELMPLCPAKRGLHEPDRVAGVGFE